MSMNTFSHQTKNRRIVIGALFFLGITLFFKVEAIPKEFLSYAPLPPFGQWGEDHDPIEGEEGSVEPQEWASQVRDLNTLEKVGILLPLSGKNKNIGEQILHGILLGYFKRQTAAHFSLHLYDTESTEEGLQRCLQQISEDQIRVVIGPVFKDDTLMVQRFPFISSPFFFSFSNDTSLSKENIFILGVTADHQMQALAQHIKVKHPSRPVMAFLPNSSMGVAFETALQKYNLMAPEKIYKINKPNDLKALKNLEETLEQNESPPPLILILGWGLESISVGAILKEKLPKVSFSIYGDIGFNHPQLHHDPLLKAAMYPGFNRQMVKKFNQIYKSFYKDLPHILSYYGYDALLTLLSVSEQMRAHQISFQQVLKKTFFKTMTGLESYDGRTGNTQRRLELYKI